MISDYKAFLAAKILNEDQVITYRQLSRALKVHVNVAKEMLFEFHRQQNGKKPGTVHATYVVAGYKLKEDITLNGAAKDGEDETLQSSPFQSSPLAALEQAAEYTPALFVNLVREEDMHQLQSLYEIITSIHVYSLAPSMLKDLQILSDSVRELHATFATEDPLEQASTYGAILNNGVRRRTGRRLHSSTNLIDAVALAKSVTSKSNSNQTQKPSVAPTLSLVENEHENVPASQTAKISQSTAAKDFFAKAPTENKAVNDTPSLKRDSSNIFKSFAKATPKLKREGTDTSTTASAVESVAASGQEDEPMQNMSEDEEDHYVLPTQSATKLNAESTRKSRQEREAALRKMMEEEESENEPTLEAIQDGNLKVAETPNEDAHKEALQVSGHRRRGKRRITKKKTVKDDEGYLVTKEESAWESFSEEEIIPSKLKAARPASSIANKLKKGTGKASQGSIVSFFGKK